MHYVLCKIKTPLLIIGLLQAIDYATVSVLRFRLGETGHSFIIGAPFSPCEDNVERPSNKVVEAQIQFHVQPVMVDHETSLPDLEPIFASHIEIQRMNTDIFIDVGIIRVPDMSSAIEEAEKDPKKMPEVKFYVLQRIAISPATFAMFLTK
jgi:hypothetical protein